MKKALLLTAAFAIVLLGAFHLGDSVESQSRFLRLFSIPLGILALALFARGRTPDGGAPRDLLGSGLVRKLAFSRHCKRVLQVPTLLGFLVVIYFAFVGVPYGPLNLATSFTWILWWAGIVFTFVLLGRLWCTACPFAFLGDGAQRVFSLGKRFPSRLRNIGLQVVLFLLLTWAFVIFGIASSPFLTGALILALIGGAVAFSMVFEKRSFCRYVCPIGALIGLYSLVSPVELRCRDKEVCRGHLEKDCFKACPMMEYMESMESNFNCNLCMDCVKACPKGNIRLSPRGFGKDLSGKWGMGIGAAAIALLGVSFFQTLEMVGAWEGVLSAAAWFMGTADFGLVFTSLFMLLAFALPLAGFSATAFLSGIVSGKGFRHSFSRFAPAFIPIGAATHLAHNVGHLIIEGASLPSVAQFSFLPGSVDWGAQPVLGAGEVFWLQSVAVMLGFFLSVAVGAGISRKGFGSLKPFIPVFVLMLVAELVSLYLLGIPMNPRHVH